MRRGTLSPVVLVSTLSPRERLLLPDPVYGRGGWQSRHALAQRHLHLPDYRWVYLGPGSDGAGRGGHPTLPLSGGLCSATTPRAPATHGERPTYRDAREHLLRGPRGHFSGRLWWAPHHVCVGRWHALWHVHT